MNTPIKFQTTILQMGNNTGIQVPQELVERLGSGKRPLVRVTINNDYTYRSAVAVMGDKYMISLSKAHRTAAGVQGGDPVEITLELDLEPRTVEIPADLKDAMLAANVQDAFEKSAPSMKKEFVRQVEEAKKPETRERRITKIVEKLMGAKLTS
ncbi:MAG: YdeI/OmpD-associated family protein [Anaerolineales bacterium]